MRKIIFCLIVFFAVGTIHAGDSLFLDIKREIIPLNGAWKMLANHQDEELFLIQTASKYTDWSDVKVPGPVFDYKEKEKIISNKCVWLKRTFEIPKDKGGKSVVLKWNGIRFGASVWINEKLIAQHATIGPNTVLIPDGIVKPGSNRIMVKVTGWNGLQKADSIVSGDPRDVPFPLIPVGASTQGWGSKIPNIYDDIWLEFYDKAYMKWILAMPDIDNKKVTFRIRLDALKEIPANLKLKVTVYNSKKTEIGKGEFTLQEKKEYQDVSITLSEVELWWPESPMLNNVSLVLEKCDEAAFTYGMRKIEVKNGDYYLNNKPIRLHGSNLVTEWNWGPAFHNGVKKYVVDEARSMNISCFRTHTLNPPTRWLDTCDHYGTMILAEMPILYNYANPFYSQKNWDELHKNALIDVEGWITKNWNHPSIIIWVMTNESDIDHTWEQTVLRDKFISIDPTRPPLRSGEVTKESHDMHLCNNFNDLPEGLMPEQVNNKAASSDPKQTISNTEYMNLFASWKNITLKYLGDTVNAFDKLNFAEIAMEHTEAMRRLDFDLILPYMYAGWTRTRGGNWRPDYPTPMAAALHSCMAPVLASLDMGNRNFIAGEKIQVPLHLINDLHQEVNAGIVIYITKDDPLFIPERNILANNNWEKKMQYSFKAFKHEVMPVEIQLPSEQGVYYLSAVTYRDGDMPVTSQRVVRTISIQKPAKADKILLLGGDENVQSWMKENKIPFSISAADIGKTKTIIIWNGADIGDDVKAKSAEILKAVEKGARLVILDQDKWDWTDLVDFKLNEIWGKSRAFIYENARSHAIFKNVSPEYFKRWNGARYNVAEREISGSFVEKAEKLIWAEKPGVVYTAGLKSGKGEIIVSQLLIKNHFIKKNQHYDPVAEQILLNFFGN